MIRYICNDISLWIDKDNNAHRPPIAPLCEGYRLGVLSENR